MAATHSVAPGEGAQERLQEALILAEPGDEIVLEAGRFVLMDGLSLDVDRVTLRGVGSKETVLDFTGQSDSGEGLLVTSDNVTLRDFAVENPKGDGIKSKGADGIVYQGIRVTWTGGPLSSNGAYGIYPVESTGVLIVGCEVSGASDAGIYVGQSRDITVRHSLVQYNVAGIEIENSRNAVVEENLATHNTGGILVFDLPGLPVMGGGDVVVRRNLVTENDVDNFAPPGNIVGGVKRGTGILVMANDNVLLVENVLTKNDTAQVMVVSYTLPFDDERYNPYPRNVVVAANIYEDGGSAPDLDGAEALLEAFGGALPPVLWDGLQDGDTIALSVAEGTAGWSLNLPRQGADLAEATPGPLQAPVSEVASLSQVTGAPAELEARLM
ncbi:parallel beta-helix domain-containing protein [Erythrobacteraceae bacterium 1XM1-14]|uniref:Parallel beta-helix domain-containing protein n=2 Tax=Altererythrobacter litoralis TaxID=3113904 RepID=A0ABU7GH09_9SPHN|nr:parallel beta-helix domain-containing protein [Erythrobacteraceae bacterium 1XM1-14]